MTTKEKIEFWAIKNFPDKDAAEWVKQWLYLFFETSEGTNSAYGMAKVFSGFGGNLFYAKYQNMLYPVCAHATFSNLESSTALQTDPQSQAAMTGIMQSIEPVVMTARLLGYSDIRKNAIELLKSLGEQS
jgi:hypothetical protein